MCVCGGCSSCQGGDEDTGPPSPGWSRGSSASSLTHLLGGCPGLVSVSWAVLGVFECELKPHYLVTDVRPGAAESERLVIKAIAHFYSQEEANALEQRLLYYPRRNTHCEY